MHAVVNLDKPAGLTSRRAMEQAGRALKTKKAGHAGTLDPIATGVLLVCLGEATKISSYLLDLEKEYTATLRLGQRTDTLDMEGEVVETADFSHVTEESVREALKKFTGEIEQVPPMYSALKHEGQPLYKLARKGVEIERRARKVQIYELELTGFEPPHVGIRVVCSKGTYIRTLADDIGMALGTLAHITELRRTRIGHFKASEASSPGELYPEHKAVYSVNDALRHLPEVVLDRKEYSKAVNGAPVDVKEAVSLRKNEIIRLKSPDGEFFAVGAASGKKVRVRRLLHLKA